MTHREKEDTHDDEDVAEISDDNISPERSRGLIPRKFLLFAFRRYNLGNSRCVMD